MGAGFNKATGFLDSPFDPTNSSGLKKGRADQAVSDAAQAKIAGSKTDPLAPPDITDELLKKARKAQMLRLMAGRGRASTFLTEPSSLAGG